MHFQFLCETMKGIRTLPLPLHTWESPAVLAGVQVKDTPLSLSTCIAKWANSNQLWGPWPLSLDSRARNSRMSKTHHRNYQGVLGFQFHLSLNHAVSTMRRLAQFCQHSWQYVILTLQNKYIEGSLWISQSCAVWLTIFLWLPRQAQEPLLLPLDSIRFTLNTLYTIEQVCYLNCELSHIISYYAGSLDRIGCLLTEWWARKSVEIGLP